jgi:hypothetical protein
MYSNHPLDGIILGALGNFLRWIQGGFWELLKRLEERKMMKRQVIVKGLTIGDIDEAITNTNTAVVEATGMDEQQQEFLDFIFTSLRAELTHKLESEVEDGMETS